MDNCSDIKIILIVVITVISVIIIELNGEKVYNRCLQG